MNMNEINAMKNELNALKEKAENLEAMITEAEKKAFPSFCRVKKGSKYTTIFTNQGDFKVQAECDTGTNDRTAGSRFIRNNYFHSQIRAEETARQLRYILRLARLKDTFCPEYTPNLKDRNEPKYGVYWSEKDKEYKYTIYTEFDPAKTYFPTAETAKEVCRILTQEHNYEEELYKTLTEEAKYTDKIIKEHNDLRSSRENIAS